jgi:peptide-methionine (S)-S-oxide reductase
MNNTISKIGFGGSCHWCTEAIFQSLNGVVQVEQGWIASDGNDASFSEAVIVHFDATTISLETLIAIHLHTHSCTSSHSMRSKYRSAIYTFRDDQVEPAGKAIAELQNDFDSAIITRIIPFADFKINDQSYLNYYYSNPEKPFCENIVGPKLRLLLRQFSEQVDKAKLAGLQD